ncbi:hypothetical protein V7S43_018980 [Phytophthora oleae]|uniref:Uncharacterized protein n=1 Tax=Phytophthora oleae TaxID=2107226 RepID=A0ABD3EPA2_9STRA
MPSCESTIPLNVKGAVHDRIKKRTMKSGNKTQKHEQFSGRYRITKSVTRNARSMRQFKSLAVPNRLTKSGLRRESRTESVTQSEGNSKRMKNAKMRASAFVYVAALRGILRHLQITKSSTRRRLKVLT